METQQQAQLRNLNVSFEETLQLIESNFGRLKTLWDIINELEKLPKISIKKQFQTDKKINELFYEFKIVSINEVTKNKQKNFTVIIWTDKGFLELRKNFDYFHIVKVETCKMFNMRQELD